MKNKGTIEHLLKIITLVSAIYLYPVIMTDFSFRRGNNRSPADRRPAERWGDGARPNRRPEDRRWLDDRRGPEDRRVPDDRRGPEDRRGQDKRWEDRRGQEENRRGQEDNRRGHEDNRRGGPDDKRLVGLNDQRIERPGSLPTDRKSQEKNVSTLEGISVGYL